MEDVVLKRARAGDADAFRELTDPFHRELHVHCYRILGSVQDAEDMVCRRPCLPPGADSSSSRAEHRFAPGSTGSRRTGA
jgi:hypothetical protein